MAVPSLKLTLGTALSSPGTSKNFPLTKVEAVRNDVGRYLTDPGVEISHDRVVILPGTLDRLLRVDERVLEVAETNGRAEFGVRLDQRDQRL